MSRQQSHIVFISPAAHGWRVRRGRDADNAAVRATDSLEAAASEAGAAETIHLALSVGAVLFERMRLPSTNSEELAGMVRLQLEKTLPFSADEVSSSFEIIEQTETESVLLAFAASNAQLDAMCEPLRVQRRLPEKITVFAMHIAASCSKGETVAAIFCEQENIVLAIANNAKLANAQTISASDANAFFAELPHALLSAELDGVSIAFTRVQLDQELAGWEAQTRQFFEAPVDLISLDAPLPEPAINLVPDEWRQEQRRLDRAARLRSRLVLAGVAYLAILLCAASYVIWLQRQVTSIDKQLAAAQPEVDFIASRKARWMALAPAIEPSRYTVEILRALTESMPSDAIRFTAFDQTPTQFTIQGEAPTANLAVDFMERLKSNPDLKAFKIQAAAPAILPNEHWQFQVFGKL